MNSLTDLARRDIAHHVHPYTDLQKLAETGPFVISRGEGVYVYDEAGRKYLEGMSGLWCANLGFSESRLVEAAHRQMQTLPYFHSFTGKVPDVTVELAEKMTSLAPGMRHVLFACSGSEAVDTAMKVAWYYHNAIGKPEKKKIIARQNAYHGVTIAAGSLTGLPYAQSGFDLPASERVLRAACPHHYRFARDGESEEAFATRLADELEALIVAEGPETVAAIIAEPVMGAGGVMTPPVTYFEKIQAVLKKYEVLLIADEVICGWGRTGQMFGSQTYGIQPDMMTTAKGLSSAYLPISALMMTDKIEAALREQSHQLGTFGHGYTYGGHPVAAAVALENLRILESDRVLAHVNAISPKFLAGLRAFADHPLVGQVRGIGLIGALELVADKPSKTRFAASAGVAGFCVEAAQREGLILRVCAGHTVAFCPPLIISEAELEEMFEKFARALAQTQDYVATL
jgi:4-aminobutyrate--pyruvate transaminase